MTSMRNIINLVESSSPSLEQLASYVQGDNESEVASDFDWNLDPAFPIDRIDHPGAEWMKDEIEMKADDGQEGFYDDMFTQPIHDDIILHIAEDGRGRIWDGYHRVGASIMKGDKTIPAIVGTRKNSKSPLARNESGDHHGIMIEDQTAEVTNSLWEMANIFPKNSGVPVVLWVSTKGGANHACRVKVGSSPNWTGEYFEITVPDQKIIGQVMCNAKALAKAKEFVTLNEALLLRLWNADIDFIDFSRSFRRV